MKEKLVIFQPQRYVAPETECLDIYVSLMCVSEGNGVPEDFDSVDYDFTA